MTNNFLDRAPICPYYPNDGIHKEITPKDGTALITLYIAGANGSCINSLRCFSGDKIDHDIQLYITIDSVNYGLTNVPLCRGVETDLLRGLKVGHGLLLAPGIVLKAASREAVKTSALGIYGWVYNY